MRTRDALGRVFGSRVIHEQFARRETKCERNENDALRLGGYQFFSDSRARP